MARTFAIGDIHGCAGTLKKLLDELRIERSDEIYFLGDYIDRGPGSKEVIDLVLKLQKENYRVYPLRGNHEQLFIDSEIGIDHFYAWVQNGGMQTLESFGILRFSQLGNDYKTFMNTASLYFDTADFIFVHAGLNFKIENPFDDEDAMLWIRDMRVDKEKIGNKIIVHGHTPTPLKAVKARLPTAYATGSINIDTGCVLKHHGYGYLSALEVFTMQLYSVRNID